MIHLIIYFLNPIITLYNIFNFILITIYHFLEFYVKKKHFLSPIKNFKEYFIVK